MAILKAFISQCCLSGKNSENVFIDNFKVTSPTAVFTSALRKFNVGLTLEYYLCSIKKTIHDTEQHFSVFCSER